MRVKLFLAPDVGGGDAPPMRNPHQRAINLSFADAITVLLEACMLPPSARTALDARIRHLQRLGVPARSPDQRMSRLAYGIPELAALATAIRLMTAFMVPTLAARYVTERWEELAAFNLAGAREVLPADYLMRRPITCGTIAIIEGNALADLGQKGRHDERYVGKLGSIVIVSDDAIDLAAIKHGTGLFLDSRAYMPTIVSRSIDLSLATEDDLASELDRLRFVG